MNASVNYWRYNQVQRNALLDTCSELKCSFVLRGEKVELSFATEQDMFQFAVCYMREIQAHSCGTQDAFLTIWHDHKFHMYYLTPARELTWISNVC